MATIDDIHILVVDDVNSMRIQIKELLKINGFKHIQVAAGTEEAFKILENQKFHLIISDWHMAPMDGLEVLRHIRMKPQHASTGFVLLTAENTREKVIEAIKAGVDDFLIKPLTHQQIKAKIFNLLVKKQALSA